MMLSDSTSELGHLKVIEVFDYYDFPRLFSCSNRSGQKFLAISVDDENRKNIFLYSPVSDYRYKLLLLGKLNLREPFSSPEDGFVYKVTVSSEAAPSVSRIPAGNVRADWLPDYEHTIESSSDVTHHLRMSGSAQELAVSGNREITDIALKLPRGETDIRSRLLGKFILSFQELVEAVGQKCAGEPTLKGPIPRAILKESELEVIQTYPGSFGVQFASAQQNDLFNDSLLGDALSHIYHLLQAEADEDQLSNLLHELKGRAISKYRSLLGTLMEINGDVNVDWGSPKEGRGGSFLFRRKYIIDAFNIVSRVEEEVGEEIRITGKLVALHTRTKSYELSSIVDEQKFSGKLAYDAPDSINHARLSEMYVATLRRIIEVNSTSGEEKERWLLVDLREPDEQV